MTHNYLNYCTIVSFIASLTLEVIIASVILFMKRSVYFHFHDVKTD